MYLVDEQPAGEDLPHASVAGTALAELDRVYSHIYSRVGNRADAEDLTQQVALKAMPRLREGAPAASVRGYLYATAHSVVGAFWAHHFRMPQAVLADDLEDDLHGTAPQASASTVEWLDRTLGALRPEHKKVLELRFLRGYSIRETAAEMGKTAGAVKLMQLRALRAAASSPARSRPVRPRREAVPGSAS